MRWEHPELVCFLVPRSERPVTRQSEQKQLSRERVKESEEHLKEKKKINNTPYEIQEDMCYGLNTCTSLPIHMLKF